MSEATELSIPLEAHVAALRPVALERRKYLLLYEEMVRQYTNLCNWLDEQGIDYPHQKEEMGT